MEIEKLLEDNQVILLLMPSNSYNETAIDIAKALSKKTVCYITTNKTFDALKESFGKKKVNLENVVFIDSISSSIKGTPEETDACYFVSSPAALTEISILASKFLRHNFEYLIFDSVTNLAIYQDRAPVAKFILNLVNKVRESKTKAVFYAMNIKEHESLIRECESFVDKVVDLSQ